MKRCMVVLLLGMALLTICTQAQAADTPLVCALTRAYACTGTEGCQAVSVKDMDLPRFISIDFGKKVIKSLDKSVQRDDTAFSTVDKVEDLTIIHGVEKRGWSLAIGDTSGELTISASGDGESFTVFGSCIVP